MRITSLTLTDLRRYRGRRFDIVHAHFGLTAWPALAVRNRARVVTLHGTDLRHPRSRRITRAASLDVQNEDYVRTARAKGLAPPRAARWLPPPARPRPRRWSCCPCQS